MPRSGRCARLPTSSPGSGSTIGGSAGRSDSTVSTCTRSGSRWSVWWTTCASTRPRRSGTPWQPCVASSRPPRILSGTRARCGWCRRAARTGPWHSRAICAGWCNARVTARNTTSTRSRTARWWRVPSGTTAPRCTPSGTTPSCGSTTPTRCTRARRPAAGLPRVRDGPVGDVMTCRFAQHLPTSSTRQRPGPLVR